MRVEVDEPGKDDEPLGVDHGGAGPAQSTPDLDDGAVRHDEVGGGRVLESRPAEQENFAHRSSSCVRVVSWSAPASIRYSTAMRTETPFATCSSTVDRGES